MFNLKKFYFSGFGAIYPYTFLNEMTGIKTVYYKQLSVDEVQFK